MANLDFSIPYNGDIHVLEESLSIESSVNNRISEVYLSGPQTFSGAGRSMPSIDINEFSDIASRIHNRNIRVNLVLNSTCDGSDWYCPQNINNIVDYVKKVHTTYNIEAITLANPILIREIKQKLPNIEICASVLSDIDCFQKAVFFRELGADTITPDANINRDLKLLSEIKDVTGARIKIMVNEGCLYKCPFRKFHFNYMSHISKELKMEKGYFLQYCHGIIYNDLSQLLKSCWIRPEDIHKYREITSSFKIVGRELPGSKVLRAAKAYMEESWDGDIMDIVSSSLGSFALNYATYLDNKSLDKYDFFHKVTSCDHKCTQCNYCEWLTSKLLGGNEFTEEKMEDKSLIEFF
jgi:collagenase-like PrtC family protease